MTIGLDTFVNHAQLEIVLIKKEDRLTNVAKK